MKKKVLGLVSIICFALLLGVAWQPVEGMITDSQVKSDFEEKAVFYAEGLRTGEYDSALDMAFYHADNEYLREDFRYRLKDGMLDDDLFLEGFRVNGINKLADGLYQLDGAFLSAAGEEEEFCPFYFYMDDEWHFALSYINVPTSYLEQAGYVPAEDVLAPGTTFDIEE